MLPGFLRAPEGTKTPLAIKIGAVLAGWIYMSNLVNLMPMRSRPALIEVGTVPWVLAVGMQLAGLLFVVGYWNRKRWAVLALIALAIEGFVALTQIRGIGAALFVSGIFRILPLVPAVIYWRQMTWK